MRTSTYLWGLLVSAVGIIAIVRGSGVDLNITALIITLLIVFSLAFAAAAILPGRRVEREHGEPAPDVPQYHNAQ